MWWRQIKYRSQTRCWINHIIWKMDTCDLSGIFHSSKVWNTADNISVSIPKEGEGIPRYSINNWSRCNNKKEMHIYIWQWIGLIFFFFIVQLKMLNFYFLYFQNVVSYKYPLIVSIGVVFIKRSFGFNDKKFHSLKVSSFLLGILHSSSTA